MKKQFSGLDWHYWIDLMVSSHEGGFDIDEGLLTDRQIQYFSKAY